MDYRSVAQGILTHIGGSGNILSAAHCATRLRLVIADNKKCSKKALEETEGVKGVFEASGQIQIILGTGTVNKVFQEFVQLAGIQAGTKEEVKAAAASRQNPFLRAIKTLGDIFVPIIPAIVASGLLMGLLEGLCNLWPSMADSGAYQIFHLFSNTAFVFLPVLIAISAAKTFGGNQFLGAVIGMIMIHPDLLNAWSVAGMQAADIPKASAWFGLYDINLVGYQGHVIPVIIAVWLMCWLEKKLHRIVPEIIDLFVTPLVTVLVTGYLSLTVIGPVFSTAENWVLAGARGLIGLPFGIGGLIIGALYAVTVVAGVHHMYNAIEAGLLSSTGLNIWMPIATAANVGQGAATLALALKSRNKKTKAVALPASLSAFLGITEPAIFGVNVRYMKPFIAGCIGGACGGLVAGLTGVGATAYGITGVFGFLITTQYLASYALVMLVSAAVSFAISWILYKDQPADQPADRPADQPADRTGQPADQPAGQAGREGKASPSESEMTPRTEKAPQTGEVTQAGEVTQTGEAAQTGQKYILASPAEGKAIPLSEVPDETFANEILGKGMAILPTEGKILAPFDGSIDTVFDTKHAIGMTSSEGVEILIHVGINTVELGGRFYQAHVAEGDSVKKGQLLLTFDIAAIQKEGYDIATPLVVTNSEDYESVNLLKQGLTHPGEGVLEVVGGE